MKFCDAGAAKESQGLVRLSVSLVRLSVNLLLRFIEEYGQSVMKITMTDVVCSKHGDVESF